VDFNHEQTPPPVPGVVFIQMKSKNLQKLIRFERDYEPDYKEVLDQIKSCLMFKSSTLGTLEGKLAQFIKMMFPVEPKDDKGRTPLHRAASFANLPAVEILMDKGHAKVMIKDNAGQTPLHAAVQKAAEVKESEDNRRSSFKAVIRQLMSIWVNVDERDNEKKTVWDYALDKNWIKDLLYISGSSTSTAAKALDPLNIPKPGPQHKASHRLEATLVEFWLEDENGKTHDKMHSKEPSIFDLIYDKNKGVEKILSRSRPEGKKIQCRWIHLPANNASTNPIGSRKLL